MHHHLLDWPIPKTNRTLQEPINSILFIDQQSIPKTGSQQIPLPLAQPFLFTGVIMNNQTYRRREGYRGRPSTDFHSWDTSKNESKMKKYSSKSYNSINVLEQSSHLFHSILHKIKLLLTKLSFILCWPQHFLQDPI